MCQGRQQFGGMLRRETAVVTNNEGTNVPVEKLQLLPHFSQNTRTLYSVGTQPTDDLHLVLLSRKSAKSKNKISEATPSRQSTTVLQNGKKVLEIALQSGSR